MKKIYTVFIFIISLILCNQAYAQKPSDIYNNNAPSILFLETQNGSGSGVIVREDGTFITCFHVIADADFIKAKTKDGKNYNVNGFRYLDPENDIAILTLSTKKIFQPIKFANKEIMVGDTIYALANPQGLQFVFSDGMISQLSKNKIQFSAPASGGSSGGALLNSSGELIGIIESQYSPSRAQNLNFAIPNKTYISHLDHRKNLNSKKAIWTDFIASRATEKQLKTYQKYAYNAKDFSTLYRYIKPIEGKADTSVDDYAFWGTTALAAYFEDYNEETLLKDAKKWFNLSLENRKNLEISSYGLILTSILSSEYDDLDIYIAQLKKYPKSYKYLQKAIKQKEKCKADKECILTVWKNMSSYMSTLYDKTYPKDE